MIIFSGFGFLPIVFLLLFSIGFSSEHSGPMSDSSLAYALFLTGIASGLVGWYLQKRPARILVDKATGREVALRRKHALFFVPLVYWGPIFIAVGLYVLIIGTGKH